MCDLIVEVGQVLIMNDFSFAVVTCDPPPTITGGSYHDDKDVYNYREVVEYSCDSGLTLIGSATSTCSENGQFQPSPPQCKSRFADLLKCPVTQRRPPATLLSSLKTFSFGFSSPCLQRLNVQTFKSIMVAGLKVLDPLMDTRLQ